MTDAVAIRATISMLEGHRNRALELFGSAFDLLREAVRSAHEAAPSQNGMSLRDDEMRDLPCSYGSGSREAFMETIRKRIDRPMWLHLLSHMGLETLMDAKAREQFRSGLEKNPPEATAENCFATMHALVEDADLIFRRGLVEAFCRLDRRFRSHDGFKLGARIILPYMFCEYTGTLNSDRAATLRDVERVFHVLDSKAPPTDWNGGICGAIRTAKPQYCGPAAYEAECPYFKVRAYQNRNAHVWFRREDLVRKVNLLLAEYYGFAIGASPDAPHERRHEPNRTPARRMGDFATPHKLAAAIVRAAQIKPGHRVLEPSAGAGNLAVLANKAGGVVTAVEAQGQYIGALRSHGLHAVVHGDFFDQTPDVLGKFERIIMNPPFDGARDVDHVSRALDYLEPGGVLVAIMSAGVEFREDKKTTDFRARVKRLGGSFVDLPDGSFRESGTMVNTCACIIGRSSYFICWRDLEDA